MDSFVFGGKNETIEAKSDPVWIYHITDGFYISRSYKFCLSTRTG